MIKSLKKFGAVLSILAIFVLPNNALALIAFDAVSSGTLVTGTSLTFAHTVTGSNTIGHVGVVQTNDNSSNRITGITWNGSAMTQIANFKDASGNTIYMWEIIAPTTGNIVVTRTGSTDTTTANAISHTGAKQTAQPDATGTSNGNNNTSQTTSVTTVADKSWAVLQTFDQNLGVISASTNSTERSAAASYSKLFDNNSAITPSGSYSMTTTRSVGAYNFTGVMASFAPALPPSDNGLTAMIGAEF